MEYEARRVTLTNFTITDALLFGRFKRYCVADADLVALAHANTLHKFLFVFPQTSKSPVLYRMDAIAYIVEATKDDNGFADDLNPRCGGQVYLALGDAR